MGGSGERAGRSRDASSTSLLLYTTITLGSLLRVLLSSPSKRCRRANSDVDPPKG